MRGGGFGTNPRSFALRVSIVGHASPRWKGARSQNEADRRNEKLANKRADVVGLAVERFLREKVGGGIPIEINLSPPDDRHLGGIAVGAYGVGSREALAESKGDRSNNDAVYRRVYVTIELITTDYHQVGRSVPLRVMPSYTRFWYVTIKSVGVSGVGIPGPAAGGVTLAIKNSLSRKEATYTAVLGGGGDPMPGDTPETNVGRKDASIVTDHELGFSDFDGEWVRIGRMDVQFVVGASRYYVSFPNLGKDAWNYVGSEFGVGLPGGYLVVGSLKMTSPDPGDWYELDGSDTDTFTVGVDRSQSNTMALTFPTESAELPATEKIKLERFVTDWTGRFGP